MPGAATDRRTAGTWLSAMNTPSAPSVATGSSGNPDVESYPDRRPSPAGLIPSQPPGTIAMPAATRVAFHHGRPARRAPPYSTAQAITMKATGPAKMVTQTYPGGLYMTLLLA